EGNPAASGRPVGGAGPRREPEPGAGLDPGRRRPRRRRGRHQGRLPRGRRQGALRRAGRTLRLPRRREARRRPGGVRYRRAGPVLPGRGRLHRRVHGRASRAGGGARDLRGRRLRAACLVAPGRPEGDRTRKDERQAPAGGRPPVRPRPARRGPLVYLARGRPDGALLDHALVARGGGSRKAPVRGGAGARGPRRARERPGGSRPRDPGRRRLFRVHRLRRRRGGPGRGHGTPVRQPGVPAVPDQGRAGDHRRRAGPWGRGRCL
ncbi:MAG: RNA binding methyltransferase FtsJ like, partial [uncultured Rubrobacteraceae bacterium]